MIDLHLHLDGSLTAGTLLKLAEIEQVILPAATAEALNAYLTAPESVGDLNEYLEKFRLPLSCMQTRETLTASAADLTCRLAGQGMLYAEIRFAPQLHTQKGLSQQQVIDAVLAGIKLGTENTGFAAGLILCCMRGKDNQAENRLTAALAGEFRSKGVCALDLAGAEGLYPTRDFGELFTKAGKAGIPITIHAGEAAGPESVWAALEAGAQRIGHGVHALADARLMERIKKDRIALECCVTSNYQTKAVLPGQDHPALLLLREGYLATINTDNMTVSDTTIEKEFDKLAGQGMTGAQKQQFLENSAAAAFLDEASKERLRGKLAALKSSNCSVSSQLL